MAQLVVRNACKIKKAHILSPGDRGWGAKLKLSPKVQKMSFFVGIFFYSAKTKKLIFWVLETLDGGVQQFSIVSRRQNMSFFYFASIPNTISSFF